MLFRSNEFDKKGVFKGQKKYVEHGVNIAVKLLLETGNSEGKNGDILVFFPSKRDLDDGCMEVNKRIKESNKERKVKLVCKRLVAEQKKEAMTC